MPSIESDDEERCWKDEHGELAVRLRLVDAGGRVVTVAARHEKEPLDTWSAVRA